jgi:deazaflavin-dependent oxidoreductase (nitroreductase family)
MIPPRWSLQLVWAVHRGLRTISSGRIGTYRPRDHRFGMLFLSTTGRRSGRLRRNGLYFLEDGDDLVIAASNAGDDADPAWYRNLLTTADATVELGQIQRPVRARVATSEERARLWPRFVRASSSYREYERATAREIPVVILEPRHRAGAPPPGP